VCAAAKNRGDFTGNYDDLVEHIKQHFNEATWQLCDGFSVNTECYTPCTPNVGGTFDKTIEGHLAENTVAKVIGMILAGLAAGTWKREIVTQYSSGIFSLKEPLAVEFKGELRVYGSRPIRRQTADQRTLRVNAQRPCVRTHIAYV
jgi:hypothetical protein